jgi:hypothetical protein
MKYFIFLFIFILTGGYSSGRSENFISNKNKLVVQQINPSWCWAASIEAVYNYFDLNINQEFIVKDFFNIKNLLPQDYVLDNARVSSNSDVYLKDKYLDNSQISSKIIAISDIKKNIDDNRPVIAMFSNHVVIVVGYKIISNSKIKYQVMDPYFKFLKESPFSWRDRNTMLFSEGNHPSTFIAISSIY